MKFRSILTFIFSTLLLAGCSEDQVLGTFNDLNLSNTYISIPAEGGDVKVTLTASEAWEFSTEKGFAKPARQNSPSLPRLPILVARLK